MSLSLQFAEAIKNLTWIHLHFQLDLRVHYHLTWSIARRDSTEKYFIPHGTKNSQKRIWRNFKATESPFLPICHCLSSSVFRVNDVISGGARPRIGDSCLLPQSICDLKTTRGQHFTKYQSTPQCTN